MFYLNGLLGIGCVFVFSMLAECRSRTVPVSWIKWIGFNSLYYLFLENPIKGFGAVVVAKIFSITTTDLSTRMLPSIIVFIISTVATAFAVKCVLLVRSFLLKESH